MLEQNRLSGTIYASRLVYAINWFTIAPALIFIQKQLNVSSIELGLIASAFFIGLMPFQLLSGIISIKTSPRFLSITGLILIGSFSIITGLSQSFTEIFISRLVLGIGSALFSSPALSLLSSDDRNLASRRVGNYNAIFSIGSGVSIIIWAVLDPFIGWRFSMYFTGILSLLCAFFIVVNIKPQHIKKESIANKTELKRILQSSKRWMLGFSAAIAPLSETIIGQFFVYYSEKTNLFSSLESGIIISLYFIVGLLGGVIYGRFYNRTTHKNSLYMLTLTACSILFITISFSRNLYVLIVVLWVIGALTAAILSMLYFIVMQLEPSSNYLPFSLGFNNFMQKVISISSPIVFIFIAIRVDYSMAWLILGVSGLFLAFLYPGLYSNIWEGDAGNSSNRFLTKP